MLGQTTRKTTKYKYAVTIILYYPDLEVFERIKSNYFLFEKILLIDNTDKYDEKNSRVLEAINDLKTDSRIIYRDMRENLGMSGALNYGYSWARDNNIDYLLTMDQDTDFPQDEIMKIIDVIEREQYNDSAFFTSNWRKIYKKRDVETFGCWKYDNDNHRTFYAMTSGTFYKVNIIQGYLPLDNLFIGMVDDDISCLLQRDGYYGVAVGDARLSQRVGETVEDTFWNRLTHKIILSPQRYYYIGRNTEYLINKFRGYKIITRRLKKLLFLLFVRTIINENNRSYKLRMLVAGKSEGKKTDVKLGKREFSE